MTIFANYIYNLSQSLRYFLIIILAGVSLATDSDVQESSLYFNRIINNHLLLKGIVTPFEKPKTLVLLSSDEKWNNHFLNPTKKITKISKGFERGTSDDIIVFYFRYLDFNILIENIMTIDRYININIGFIQNEEFRKKIYKSIKSKKQNQSASGRGVSLIKTQVGDTELELSLGGNINIDGRLIHENKDLVMMNLRDNESWDLDIEQKQKFNIEGTIGEKWFINVDQDSEADFSWENDLSIEYKGDKNDIFKRAQGGNINLSLPSTQFVSVGSGSSEGLFGLKFINQLGPVELQTIISKEQVTRSAKKFEGGESSETIDINDYSFIKDRYFFIDNQFKLDYYPLTAQSAHVINPSHVVGGYEIYKRVYTMEVGVVPGTAFLDPLNQDESYKVEGNWKRLEEGIDYEIDRLMGWVRLNNISSNEAVGIAFTYAIYDQSSQSFFEQDFDNGTDLVYVYDFCNDENYIEGDIECLDWTEGNGIDGYQPPSDIRLKLIKDTMSSTPNSKTWPLMFKNVYSLSASNISADGLAISIVRDLGAGEERTHTESGVSYLNLFGLDSKDQNNQTIAGGDGNIDLYSSFLNLKYGELFIPSHLPFSYDDSPRIVELPNQEIDTVLYNGEYTYWGNNEQELENIFEYSLNDSNGDFECNSSQCGPSMYYSTVNDKIIDEHEFLIKVTHSSKSSTVNLGFMIREGSESVRLNGNVMQKDKDYSIDYFSGTLNFINDQFLDPTADIEISYEENELISFDQKLLIGTHFKYDLNNNNFLSGGLYYYNQSLVEQKVDIGYEPMRNVIWNINGKYQKDIDFLTRAIDVLPIIETTKPSRFSLEGEYAQVFPNPNPLDEAFIDDFESSKRTTSLNMLFRQWKLSSMPDDSLNFDYTNKNRGEMFWYNPEADTYVTDIWPNKSTSIRPDQNTIKTLWIETNFQSSTDNQKVWNGITVPLFSSDYDQSQSKYLDVWLNANDVEDELLRLHIDLGFISEDADNDGNLDTEDEDVYGGGLGDGYLNDPEDIGIDKCTDSYEDGWGGCLCNLYSSDIYSVESLQDIYNYSVGDTLFEYCLEGVTYQTAFYNNPDLVNTNIWIDSDDPNGDNWAWSSGSSDFSMVNGTEGNGQTIRYPDTEDLDNNFSLDQINDYFSFTINPLEKANEEESMVLTETEDNGIPTGWKLFRIPLAQFNRVGESINWSEIRSIRLWLDSELNTGQSSKNLIKIAKIEVVSNEWKELGTTDIDKFSIVDDLEFDSDSLLTIEVLNTDENPEYTMPDGVIIEYDEYNEMYLKEQSLAIAFKDPNNINYGINPGSIAAIKKSFSSLPSDKRNSFFAYKYMKMFVYGGDPSNYLDWPNDGSMKLLFRIGKDDEYYEIMQPIYQQWDSRNEIKINLDLLSSKKLEIHPLESFNDYGFDGVQDDNEDGCGGKLPMSYNYENIIADNALYNDFNQIAINDTVTVCGQIYWDLNCQTCTSQDPNGDNWLDCGLDNICSSDEENYDSYEGNGIFDEGEHGTEGNGIFDTNDNGLTETFNDVWDDGNEGVFDSPDSVEQYDDITEVWSWDSDKYAISDICSNCTELRVKGEPAINKIEYIIVGIANQDGSTPVSGKVLLDELRLTKVKREKGQAFRVKSSISLGDVLNISASYTDEEADFHRLQERLGAGSSNQTISLNATLNSNKVLPENWKIKIPMKFSYYSTNSTPKFIPGSDILSGGSENAPDSIKSINNKISLSTSFKKTSRSDNWLINKTIDNIELSLSAIQSQKSTSTIRNEDILDINGQTTYGYTFDKENYLRPLKFMKNMPLVGNFFNDARMYFTPQKIGAKMEIAQYEKTSLQRLSGAETATYSYTMKRSFNVNHKFSKSLQSNYTKNINSNLDQFKENPLTFIENMSPGQIQRVDEKLVNTFSPDFLKWLSPSIKFNPSYSWDLVQVDTTMLANIGTNNTFKAGIILKPKDLVEVFYKPKSSSSSRTRRRSRSSSNSGSEPLLKIENKTLKTIFDFIHKNTARVSKISLSYDLVSSHSYSNVDSEISPDYIFRFGLSDIPSNLSYADESTGQIGSSSNNYKTDIKVNTNVNIAKNVIMSLDYKKSTTNQNQSTGIPTTNIANNYFPIGVRGDEGIQVPNWNLTWSGIEKMFWFNKYFKTISLNHSYNGNSSSTYKNNELGPQTWDYSQAFSPLIGMNFKTQGKNPLIYKINFSRNLNIKNSGTSIERSYSNKINSTLSFSKKGGINIPLFFRDDLYLPNDISFNVDFSFDDSYSLISSVVVTDISQLNEQTKNLNWSCKPNINYSFSKWVSGNFYFIYGVSNNKTTGRSEETDFGFSVNIRIQG